MKFTYLRKSILFLDSEIDLLKLIFPQANQPVNNSITPYKSNVYFTPKSDGLGIDSMGEFVVSFKLSGQFLNDEGNPAPLILISQALERAFNFSFGGIYKSKKRIFSRKPYNLTKSLDYLKNLLIRESRKKKMKKDAFADR